jgi:membrane protease YdiL (CAAX protease family)
VPAPDPADPAGPADPDPADPDPAAEPHPDVAARKAWGLGDVATGLVVSTLTATLAIGMAVAAQGHGRDSLLVAVAGIVGLWIGLAGAVVVAARKQRSDVRTEFGLRIGGNDVGLGLVAGIASQLILLPVIYEPIRRFAPDLYDEAGDHAENLFDVTSGPGVAMLALLIVVGAPLVEELFYRGLFQRALLRRTSPAWAIGVTAAVFAVTHFQAASLPGLLAFGVVLGWLTYRAGRLGPAVVAHIAFNGVTVAALLAR